MTISPTDCTPSTALLPTPPPPSSFSPVIDLIHKTASYVGGCWRYTMPLRYNVLLLIKNDGLRSKIYRILTIGGIAIACLGFTCLYAGDPLPISSHLITDINYIQQEERAGHYATAVESVKLLSTKASLLKDRVALIYLSQTQKRLEDYLLTHGCSHYLFDPQGRPSPTLLTLLHTVGMPIQEHVTLDSINAWAQRNLLRNEERWSQQSEKFEALQERILPVLTQLGFINEVSPHFTQYVGAIVHGGTVENVRKRLGYLVDQWKKGITFSVIYFLGGERPLLSHSLESTDRLTHDTTNLLPIRSDWVVPTEMPTTEIEMIRLVWDQSDIPEEMRKNIKIHFISSPMIQKADGSLSRPTTADTVEAWMASKPTAGRYLSVSNSPHIIRQDLAVRHTPPTFTFDSVGPHIDPDMSTALILDELARHVFQLKSYRQWKNI